MKVSIKTKITLMVALFAMFIVGTSWVLCKHFIKGFFVMEAKQDLIEAYDVCNEVFAESEDGIVFDSDFYNKMGKSADLVIIVYNKETNSVYTSIRLDGDMVDVFRRLMNDMQSVNDRHINAPGQYVINRNHDSTLGKDYYDLIGQLDNGNMIIIRSPIERIDSTMDILAKIFIWIAVGLIVFGSIFMLVFSNIFSSPIKRLSIAARQMAELDFDVKVPIYSKDEIGELSTCMNDMSSKLELTISELKSANARLERDIEDREKLDDMRKEFLSHVSHELKTPIALIQGYAEGLKDNLFDDEESKNYYTDVIIDEAGKMNALVKKLMALNEIEFGEAPLNIERFELVQFIKDILASSKILIDDAEARVIFEEEGRKYVWADEYMIEEVFTNYLTNAIHYVKPGGIIKVYFEQVGTDIRVNVYNEGDTIADEDINNLFEKFYKADKARTREYGGSGIGLSIVAATMKAHNKNYGVYNVSDGVVFYFDLDANMPC